MLVTDNKTIETWRQKGKNEVDNKISIDIFVTGNLKKKKTYVEKLRVLTCENVLACPRMLLPKVHMNSTNGLNGREKRMKTLRELTTRNKKKIVL